MNNHFIINNNFPFKKIFCNTNVKPELGFLLQENVVAVETRSQEKKKNKKAPQSSGTKDI